MVFAQNIFYETKDTIDQTFKQMIECLKLVHEQNQRVLVTLNITITAKVVREDFNLRTVVDEDKIGIEERIKTAFGAKHERHCHGVKKLKKDTPQQNLSTKELVSYNKLRELDD